MNTRKNGFTIMLAVIFIAIISMTIIMLTQGTLDLSTQTFLQNKKAQRADIFASAQTWTEANLDHFTDKQPGYQIALPTDSLNIPNSSCTLTLKEITQTQAVITINTQISHGRKTFDKTQQLAISYISNHPPN